MRVPVGTKVHYLGTADRVGGADPWRDATYAAVRRRNMEQSSVEDQDHKVQSVIVPLVEVASALFMPFKAPEFRRSPSGR